jgi:hypothetical protein
MLPYHYFGNADDSATVSFKIVYEGEIEGLVRKATSICEQISRSLVVAKAPVRSLGSFADRVHQWRLMLTADNVRVAATRI